MVIHKLDNLKNEFIELSQDLMCVASTDGFFKYVNPAFEKLSGYTEKELLSKPFLEFAHPDDHLKTSRAVSDLSTGKVLMNFENRLLCKDGSIKDVQWAATPQVDEKIIYCVGRDITAQNQAKKQIAKERETAHNYLKIIASIVIVINKNGEITLLNKKGHEILGYKDGELIGKNWFQTCLPKDISADIKTYFDELIAGNIAGQETNVNEVIKKDGQRRIIKWYNKFLKDDHGNITAILSSGEDVTAQKFAEKEIIETKQFYEEIIEGVQDGIWVTDKDDIIIFANDEMGRIAGIPPKKIQGNNILKDFPEATTGEIIPFYKQAKREKNPIWYEIKVKTPAGKDTWQNGWLIPKYEDGIFKGIICTIRDITDVKQAENELIQSEEKFRGITEQITEMIFVTDGKGVIKYISPASISIFGHEPSEMEGNLFMKFLKKTHVPKAVKAFTKTFKSGTPTVKFELLMKHKNGSYFNGELAARRYQSKLYNGTIGTIRDISIQKTTEQELIAAKQKAEESEAKFRTVFKESNSVQLLIDPKTGKIIDANQAACNFYGYAYAKLTSLKIQQINQSSEKQIEQKMLGAKSRKINHFEFKHKLSDGTIKDVEVYSNPIVIDNEKVLISIINDVTARKLAEQGLVEAKAKAEENEEKIRQIFENSTIVHYSHDLNHVVNYVSPQVEDILGYTPEEIKVNWTTLASDNPINKIAFEKTARAIKTGEKQAAYQVEFVHKNGKKVLIEAHEAPVVKDGKTKFIVGSFADITERKKLEETKDILVAISNKILTTSDLEEFFQHIFIELRKVVETNNFFIGLYDEESEMISTPFIADKLDTNIINFPVKKTMTGQVIANKKSMFINQADFQELIKKGVVDLIGPPSDVWIGVPLFSGEKVIGVIVIQNYEGEKRLTRADLSVLEYVAPQISLAIERKNFVDDLKYALGKAQEADRLKSAFLANMSHEIRTPMNGILGFTELLKEPGLSGEEQQKYIGIIESSGDRMLSTIHDIIDISKIESGQVVLSLSELNINKEMDDLYDFFLPEAEKKNIQLSVSKELVDQKANIETDIDKLNSVITNLIKNAIKFTDYGKIEFGYFVNEKAKQPELLFYVKDTGVGVSKEKQKVIFDRFVQADNEHARVYDGSGLGLAISKAYVEMLKGKIWIESEEGVGTAFYFTHPFNVSKDHTKNIVSSDKSNIKNKNLKILIVEDEDFAIEFLSVLLKDYSKNLLIARTGIEAVDLCQANPDIDLILMDIRLPEISGYEAVKRIRKFNKEVFILAQTAFALAGDKEKSIAAGCNDYITKPIKKENLFKIIADNF